jgi:hypothetical protein
MKKSVQKTKGKTENQKIDEEVKKAYKEMPAKKHNNFDDLMKFA